MRVLHEEDDEGPAPRRAEPIDPAGLDVEGARPGWVYLVGAGPGDPGLLTVRGAALVATADVLACDRLAPERVLGLADADAEIVRVGKSPERPSWSQADINRLVVEKAQAGQAVVRLKGGDPFVFARGGEEALFCREAGVPVEVVSGVSSTVAAPTAAGIPVTHRGVAPGVAFVTGHEDPAKDGGEIDWPALARFPGTLVFVMGVGRLGSIVARLLAHGMPADTPVAVVRWGTTELQETVAGDLVSIVDEVRRVDLQPPATIVVGDVVELREAIGVSEQAAAADEPPAPPAQIAAG